MQDKYVTSHAIPRACLATLFLQEIQDRTYIHRYVYTSELRMAPKSKELQRAPKRERSCAIHA
jgi:hypothetical protein